MKIHVVKADQGKFTSYVEYEFENTLISGYSLSSGGDKPSESISFNFTKIQVKYTPTDKTGAQGTPVTAAYDIALAKLT
jgi:type VI secretion system secreted protein Hcp